MALRDQPYFPLYVQDYLTDEKLNMCSASSQGVFIKILCIMHKSESYGKILFKQKFKQNESMIKNFALQISKQLPFDAQTIENALHDLIDEGVLILSGDELLQKRMVKDGEISTKRSEAGKSGGGNPNLFKQKSKQIAKQKNKQNTECENEGENEGENKNKKNKYPKFSEFLEYAKTLKTWHTGFENQLEAKFNQWSEEGWRDGHGNKIKNWKTKIQNTIIYFKNGNNKGFGTRSESDYAETIARADAIIDRAFGKK